MSEVKRYTTNESYAHLPYGTQVVLAADYDALAADNARLKAALERIVGTKFNWRESSAREMGEIAHAALADSGEG